MTTIAIHQPNYLPWLGYFAKMARADVFVFLDDVQFSKQSYINRVQILGNDGARWLTIPVRVSLGQAINEVRPAKADWVRAHLDTLRGFYKTAPSFKSVWPDINALYGRLSDDDLASSNRRLIEEIATRLGLSPNFYASSEFATGTAEADERLIEIVRTIAVNGTYLSGKGGANYQDPAKFAQAGVALDYVEFEHPRYTQYSKEFVAGLSILDAVFHLGWDGAAALVRR